jgi:aminopeptidase N
MYEMTFRYPKNLDLVATGDVVDDKTEGEMRITRRRTPAPVRLVGFNLGNYERQSVTRGGFTVEVYANRRLEAALQPKPRPMEMLQPPPVPRMGRRPGTEMVIIQPPSPNPLARLEQMASEVAGAFEFMAQRFGPPPLKRLTVSPIPGRFGQGFPGLVYLSTLSYLDPSERPSSTRNSLQQTFFSELLQSHEAAHQWWGNVVTSAGYQDEWIMEALANYSALLYLEKRKGARQMDVILDSYRTNLLAKDENGRTVDAIGPISWGHRLRSSQSPNAWHLITYEKGAWIVHMLRRRMGDQRFHSMLAELFKRYHYKPFSNDDFRRLAAEFLPPKSPDPKLETFFNQWVYSAGIPTLKLTHSVRGLKLTGKIEQTEVDEDFAALVPVEIATARGKPIVHWIQSSSEPVTFTVTLPAPPTRVTLDTTSILAK